MCLGKIYAPMIGLYTTSVKSIMGMIGLFGAFGIMLTQFIGGRVFDAWGPSWPFVIVGLTQVFIMIAAILERIFAPGGKQEKQR